MTNKWKYVGIGTAIAGAAVVAFFVAPEALVISGLVALSKTVVGGNKALADCSCNDGWQSASFGKQGACSWHDGVNAMQV